MRKSRQPARSGSALVITLVILALVTILAVGMLRMTSLERASARNTFESERAQALSDAAADHALALVRDAIVAAENTTTNSAANTHKFWASQPGRITVFNSDGSISTTDTRELYSTNTTLNAPVVDLNAVLFGGTHPIVVDDGSGSAPTMNVPWVNVLTDSSQTASKSNPIIGRYAFWVDDETTKLDINTADGSVKSAAGSFGAGTPSEMNLQVLTNGATSLTAALAASIAQQSGAQYGSGVSSRPFNSVKELLQIPGVNSALFDTNGPDLTTFNSAPELNLFGEPRIYLTTALPSVIASVAGMKPTAASTPLSFMTGPYPNINPNPATEPVFTTLYAPNLATAQPLNWIYPSSGTVLSTTGIGSTNSQLPNYTYTAYGSATSTTVRLPQFFRDDGYQYVYAFPAAQAAPATGYMDHSLDYDLGMRMARYIKGYNSQNQPINWPILPGSGTGGFAGKYTDRQIDEITLQILSLLKQTHPDHYYGYTDPYLMQTGFLSGKPLRGLNRGPRLTEVVLKINTIAGDPPVMQAQFFTEYYLPKEFAGVDISWGEVIGWTIRINYKDWPLYTEGTATPLVNPGVTGPAPMGGYWSDNLLQITDQNGQPAGVDLFGNPGNSVDPDQTKAALYHDPWALKDRTLPWSATTNPYMGSGFAPPFITWGNPIDVTLKSNPANSTNTAGLATWKMGYYYGSSSSGATRAYPMKSGTTSITIGGGLAIWIDDRASGKVDAVPIDSILPNSKTLTTAQQQKLLSAVIAIPGSKEDRTIPIPGQKVFHMQVADPLVNSFPGDWQGSVLSDLTSSEITMPIATITPNTPQAYLTGRNTISQPPSADPQANWWPPQDTTIPKSRRFPSTGHLQYIRTGVMPDPANDSLPLAQQKGTPWRTLNFSPSTAASQQTSGGSSFPDWLLLDLFTTPAVFQPLGTPLPPPIIRTWGGATAGRINPNAVLAPFGILRTKPLEALFKDVTVSTSYDGSGNPIQSTIDAAALAKATASYVQGLGRPLMVPGEICNVPEIANYVYQGVDSSVQSRNDLVRQTVGNLTTRSNTFTVWARGQVIQKRPGNTNYGTFESGDIVLGQSRMRYVIQRYLDPGTDGVYGNTTNPGTDGVLNTPDDPTTAATGVHPTMTYPLPYKYRIVSVAQVQ